MASEITVINAALRKLGALAITSLTEQSRGARLASDTYADLRDSLLRMHPWNFATSRQSLAADAALPDWGYKLAYTFPASPLWALRILEIDGETLDVDTGKWKVEGRKILTDLSAPLKIRFIFRVEDEDLMDPSFREALASFLASEWAIPITKQTSLQQEMLGKYRLKLADAKADNGQEGMPDKYEADEWADARL